MNDLYAWLENLSKNWSSLLDFFLKIAPFVLKAIQWIRNRIKWRGISEDTRRIAFAIHSFSWITLQQAAPVIQRVGLISRPEIEQIENVWKSADTPILLHGEAGTGKSGIALRLGQALANNGIPVLFLRASDFPNGQEPVAIIQNRMALSNPLMDALAKLSQEKTFSVILDQLDSVAGTDLGKNFTSFLKVLAGIPNIKVLAITRSYELLHDQDISSLGFQSIESGRLTNEQSYEYLYRLGLTSPSQHIVDLASNLLNLSLIADVVALTPAPTQDIGNEVELWKQFFVTIEQREGDKSAEFVLKLAREVTIGGERHFPVQFPNAEIRRRLLSRGVLLESPGRRFSFRHEQLQVFLCAYSLLPEQLPLLRLLEEFNNNIPNGVISWLQLLYHNESPDIEATFIDEVLGAKKELPFYTRILVLENLRVQINPAESAARILTKHLVDRAYHSFFFEGLENPAWIAPLFRSGIFHSPPDPIEVQTGSYQLPLWPAGAYLARFAGQHEEIVTDFVQSTRTENWRVQEILVDALMKISPIKAAGLVSVIDGWLSGRFSGLLPIKLMPLANHLLENGFIEAAVHILEYVITPILPPIGSKYVRYRSTIHFRSDHYWVNEYCEKQFPQLVHREPTQIVLAFERQLKKAIELTKQFKPEDADLNLDFHWSMDISNISTEQSYSDAVDILISGLRDGLAEVCKQSIEEGNEFLTAYLNSEHMIFKRIAMYILRGYGRNYPELINQVLLQRENLEGYGYANEYRGLMRDQFNTASEEVRAQVISWILTGPKDVDARANWRAQRQNREVTDIDRVDVIEDWSQFHLEIVRASLSGEALSRLNELTAKYGKPDIEERPNTITTTWGGAPSPVPDDELAKKSFDELKQLFLTYVPEDLFLNPRESLAEAFHRLVSEDPVRYRDFAAYLTDPAIRFVYIYHYLSGMREGVKSKDSKLDDAILGLCEYVVAQKEDPYEKSSGEFEPGLFEAQMEVVRLFEEALHSNDPYLTREQLDRIRFLLIILAHHPDPKSDTEGSTSFDPFTHSLNCVRGQAMHGIFHYSLYLIRQHESETGQKLKEGYLEPEIQQILEEKLDVAFEPSLAVHSVYGAFVPQLHYLSREWLEQHLTEIFPESEEKDNYWRAAWDAYIFGPEYTGMCSSC